MRSFKCNSCLRTLQLFAEPTADESPRSYLSQCKHIFCGDCRRKTHPNCGVCCRPMRFIEIKKGMRYQYRIWFAPLQNVIRKVCTAVSFQARHQEWNIDRLVQINSRCKQHEEVLRQRMGDVDGKIRNLAEQNEKLKVIIMIAMESKKREVRLQPPPPPRRKRSSPKLPTPQTHQMRKYMFQPNQYENAEPVSPRRLPCASLTSSTLYNPQQKRKRTQSYEFPFLFKMNKQ